jgi:hypothetical protein
MYTLSEKSSVPRKTSVSDSSSGKTTLDQRPEAGVQRKLIQMVESHSLVQRKLNVIQKASPEEELPAQGKFNNPIQLKAAQLASTEEELPAQGKFDVVSQLKTAQLASPEEELPAQGKFENNLQLKAAQLASPEEELPAQGKLIQREQKPNNTGMPDHLKSGVESLSGLSMDHVKVHYGSEKPAQLNALAYAQGSDIHIGPGQEKHLPHEAWHVVQQMQGRVQPTTEVNNVAVNDDTSLESEADSMGEKASKR